MARRKELSDELDPQVREFVELLRGVVDRAGLNPRTLADRTGYGRASWERYLDGRQLAPKGAVVALAEAAGTPADPLTAVWEPAERAWSRAELRNAGTQDALRIVGVKRAEPDGPSRPGGSPRSGGSRRWGLFVAGVMGVVIVVVGGFLLTGDGDPKPVSDSGRTPSPSASSPAAPPSGVLCGGAACTGRDAEEMGCSGDLVTTARSATVGTVVVEVRYSRTCGAAWGRIVQAAPGDSVRVTVGKTRHTARITAADDTIAYTPMIAVPDPARATACASLASGETGCTG
ncbi:helix-turn-helix domain-containing protein [Streptomyces antibioticus]|uniref:helix-turn-helix domain-containing protein n=1 Tax=Streptomyces antibioticus TaxID=1890 RepID=UPI00224EFAB1|nr:XRE family transcriptional regulator [Streptomyces antibioticus]MCX4737181.1 XRE family transcriptional regulator [Streptomyces antibioticus]